MFRPSRLKSNSSLRSPSSSWVLNAMQLLQYGNLTPQNVVCCGPCDDPEYNLQQGRLKKKNRLQKFPNDSIYSQPWSFQN